MLVKWIWDWNGKDPEVRRRALTGEENIVGEQRSLIKNGPLELTNYNAAQKPNVFPPGPVGCSAKVLVENILLSLVGLERNFYPYQLNTLVVISLLSGFPHTFESRV